MAGIAQAFGSLPQPVQSALTVLGGVAGVAALGAGAFLTITPRILDSMNAFKAIAPEGSRAAGALGKVGKAAGIAGAAFLGFEAVKSLHNSMQPATASLEECQFRKDGDGRSGTHRTPVTLMQARSARIGTERQKARNRAYNIRNALKEWPLS